MKHLPIVLFSAGLLILTSGCWPVTPSPAPLLEPPPVTSPEAPAPTQVLAPTQVPPPTPPTVPDEAILIQQPAPGSRVTSPVTVAGLADPTFEQTLVVRMLLEDGAQIALLPTIIQADTGQRGPFQIELEFDITGERQAFIQVFTESARDGQITHLAAVGVTISDTGPAGIRLANPQPEQIHILQPSLGDLIAGGVVTVVGYGWAGFENTLVIEIQDQDGNIVGQTPVTVESLEMGQSGPFRAQVPYSITTAGPGRVTVRDISPAFGGSVHLNSVDIRLAP